MVSSSLHGRRGTNASLWYLALMKVALVGLQQTQKYCLQIKNKGLEWKIACHHKRLTMSNYTDSIKLHMAVKKAVVWQ